MNFRLVRLLLASAAVALATAVAQPAATFDEALAAKRTGDHARAIALLQELAAAQPEHAEILFHLGTVQGWAGRYEDALVTFERALRLAPSDVDVQLGYGRVLAWSGKHARAEAIFRRILEAHPENLEAQNMLARVLTWQRQLDAAGDIYRKILSTTPSNTDALIGQGDVERLQDRFADARDLYRQALALEPDSTEIQQRLASVRGAGRWRLDAGAEISTFAGNSREDWHGIDVALRYSVDRRTGASLAYDYARRFGLTDVQYSLGGDRRFNDRWNGSARLSFTPQADFLARRTLALAANWRMREAGENSGPIVLLADYRASDFGVGTAHSLWLGATRYFSARLALTAKGLLSRNLNDDWTSGWQVRLDGEPTDHWRWHAGYADGYESLSSTVFDFTRQLRTRAVFVGAYREFSSTLGVRVDLTRESTTSLPARSALHVGITTRF